LECFPREYSSHPQHAQDAAATYRGCRGWDRAGDILFPKLCVFAESLITRFDAGKTRQPLQRCLVSDARRVPWDVTLARTG
jgi:hypothetical protein